MAKKMGEQVWQTAAKIAQQDLNKPLDSKGGFSNVNVNLFGEKVPKVYFRAATTKDDNGFMMCSCGTSISDYQNYVVTTHYLKADEVPELCNDAKTFAELVAKLLNEYYNKK